MDLRTEIRAEICIFNRARRNSSWNHTEWPLLYPQHPLKGIMTFNRSLSVLYQILGKKLDFIDHSNETISEANTLPAHFKVSLQTIPGVNMRRETLFGRSARKGKRQTNSSSKRPASLGQRICARELLTMWSSPLPILKARRHRQTPDESKERKKRKSFISVMRRDQFKNVQTIRLDLARHVS